MQTHSTPLLKLLCVNKPAWYEWSRLTYSHKPHNTYNAQKCQTAKSRCEKFLAFYPQGKCDLKHCPRYQWTVRCKISLCNLCFYPLLQGTLWLSGTIMQLWLNRILCPCRHLLRLITGKDSRVLTCTECQVRGITQPLHGTGPELQMRTLKGLFMLKYHGSFSDLGN